MDKYIICLFLALIPLSSFSQKTWELKKKANNISIYTRALPNEPLDEFKAETTIKVSIENVLEELLTAPTYFDGCNPDTSYYLKNLSENEHVFYAYKSLPWPIKDRDIITLLKVEKISETKIKLILKSLPNLIPKKEKTIRINKLMGHWLLEEKDGETKITQQLFVNPEGSLPPFVINLLLIKGPFKTFSDLRKTFNKSAPSISKK